MKALVVAAVLLFWGNLGWGLDQAIEAKIDGLLSKMTLEEKVGQMTQAARDYLSTGDIEKYKLGSVLSGGGSVPQDNSVDGWRKMVRGYQDEALRTRLQIPLLYGVDAVHGHNNLHGATIFPHNIALGAAGDPDLVFRVERATAEEVKATGIQWVFAPCVAPVQDLRWGRTYEGFSKDPLLDSRLARAAVRGFQGETLGETGITASVKHFAADGGTKDGVDQGNAVISDDQLRTIFLAPYEEALKSNPGTVMASFSSINGLKMHANKKLLTGWLKEKMGFEGFVISDWAAVKQLSGNESDQVRTAVNAGIDMVMVPDTYQSFIGTLVNLVRAKEVPQGRIDDAVRRILRVKFTLHLFESPVPQGAWDPESHKKTAREAVRKSFTLLKDDGGILPLKKGTKILVVGPKADDVGALCGGWTMTWQGGMGPVTPGDTVFQGLVRVYGESAVKYSEDGNPPLFFQPDAVVFCPGERPYAEMKGDSPDLRPDGTDLRLFSQLKATGLLGKIPLVTFVVSGRPLVMNEILDASRAVVALWLPGTEAGAVAEVVSGEFRPTGHLPQPWPGNADQSETRYPLGFGLTY